MSLGTLLLGTLCLLIALATMKLGTLERGTLKLFYSISNFGISLLASQCSGEDIHDAHDSTL
jgi:hypothetical protein